MQFPSNQQCSCSIIEHYTLHSIEENKTQRKVNSNPNATKKEIIERISSICNAHTVFIICSTTKSPFTCYIKSSNNLKIIMIFKVHALDTKIKLNIQRCTRKPYHIISLKSKIVKCKMAATIKYYSESFNYC